MSDSAHRACAFALALAVIAIAGCDGTQTSVAPTGPEPATSSQVNQTPEPSSTPEPVRTAWAAGVGAILSTTDGVEWTDVTGPEDFPTGVVSGFGAIVFPTSRDGWAAAQGGCLVSQDCGDSWRLQSFSDSSGAAGLMADGLSFVDEKHGWAVGSLSQGSFVIATNDGGVRWKAQDPGTGSTQLTDVSFADRLHGWICGRRGTILATDDGGVTWRQQAYEKPEGTLETLYWAITCVDAQTAWVVGQDREGAPLVRTTVDGGTTWKSQDPDVAVPSNETSCALLGVDFLDALNGCAVGKLGSITVTHDGGQTWQSVGGSIDNGLSGVAYASEAQLWVVGGLGTILGSEDGGETWDDQSPEITMMNGMHLGDLGGIAVPPAAPSN